MRKQKKHKTIEQNETNPHSPADRPRDTHGRGSWRKGRMMRKLQHKGGLGHKRNRRPLGHGDLGLLILSLIQETPRHGYDLITQIETRTGGAYKPSPGVMYPALEVLQDMGHVKIVPTGAKKIYHVTDDGNAVLVEKAADLVMINEQLERLASPKETDETPTVKAAVQRLHHTVRSHMRGENVSDSERDTIMAILEDARQKIGDIKKT